MSTTGLSRLLLTAVTALAVSLPTSPGWAAGPGQQLWVGAYDGPRDDNPRQVAVDPTSGNVYVTGSSAGTGTGFDYVTVAYDSAGARLWDARYDGPNHGDEYAAGLSVDPGSGTVYVTGQSRPTTSGFDFDYATVAYSAVGVQLWVARYNGPGNGDDEGSAVAVDPRTGTVYVTGQSARVIGGADFTTIAYSADGVQLRVVRYDGPAGDYDRATAIGVDPVSGTIYVVGNSTGVGSGLDYATVAYSRTGRQLWVARYDGPGNYIEFVRGLAVDPGTGNVYVTGASPGTTTNYDFATVAYSPKGTQLWVNRYSSSGSSSYDYPAGIAVDPGTGNVYVTGSIPGERTPYDYFDYTTLAYTSSGAALWGRRYDGPTSGSDSARAVAVDPTTGNVYVTGESAGKGLDFLTVGYSPTGSPLWVQRYLNPGQLAMGAVAIAVDPNQSHVYVTGTSQVVGQGTRGNFTTVAYAGG